jgi:pimeloyl-ACP methyl ester carboxylesterase
MSTKIDETRYPPPGQMIDIGGYSLHLQRMGDHGRAVVFDSGLGNNSLTWALVQPEIAKSYRTYSYDRAGYNWSQESPLERTCKNSVEELHSLLKSAQIPKPYILVGHSLGGLNVLLYAYTYPEEVSAVILVDAAHEDLFKKAPFLQKPYSKTINFLSKIGYLRLSAYLWQKDHLLNKFPSDIRQMWIATLYTNKSIETMTKELDYFDISAQQIKAAKIDLKDMPLTVITGNRKITPKESGLSQEQCDQCMEIWMSFQKDLLSRSTRSKQLLAENSGHKIPLEQPEIIIQAIKDLE